MTTLVVVALDDFALRIESDDPEVPAWLLHTAEMIQKRIRAAEPAIRQSLRDMMLWGATAYVRP